ncbi:hypothetical protein WJX81_000110 [Elliptochloris bilobata]|uniref:F-box domain-containing protein n=1 Tax=Elliptochloris bilobata TaxID=381761 RepID=A0AAW1QJM9_9CHLO
MMAPDEAGLALTDLPIPLLERVMLLLDKRTVCSLAACSVRLRNIASDEDLWRQLCERSFPHTDPRRWLALEKRSELLSRRSLDGLAPPHNYRSVFAHLSLYEQLIGSWRLTEKADAADFSVERLYNFAWEWDCVSCVAMEVSSAEPLWNATAALRLGAPGCCTALRLVDATHAILHEFDAAAFCRAPSAAAHAATAVAVVGSPTSLGSSPEGTFGFEMLKFMQTTVGIGGRRRRRSSRGSSTSPGGRPAPLRVHHLTRVPVPAPTRAHPLAGLWVADFSAAVDPPDDLRESGVQVLALTYDFSGVAARLVAVKVAGDNCIPPGRAVWTVLAAPDEVLANNVGRHTGRMLVSELRGPNACDMECLSSDSILLRWFGYIGDPGHEVPHMRINPSLLRAAASGRIGAR